MVKHTETIHRQSRLFECIWQFCRVGIYKVNVYFPTDFDIWFWVYSFQTIVNRLFFENFVWKYIISIQKICLILQLCRDWSCQKKAIKYFVWDFFFSAANVYGLIKILSRTTPNIMSEHFNRIHATKICFTVSCLGEMIGSKMSLKKTFL